MNIEKLSKEEMKLISASTGGTNNTGNTNCGQEPDPITHPDIHDYWRACMESNGKPVICPPEDPINNG